MAVAALFPKLLSSLKVRIALTAVAMVLGSLWGFALLVAEHQESRLRELLGAQQRAVLGYVADHIDSVIRLRLDSLEKTAQTLSEALLHDRPRLLESLALRPVLMQLFDAGIIVVQPDGVGAFADYPVLPDRARVDFRSLDVFQQAQFDGAPAMGQPFRGRFTDKPVVAFAAPVFAAGTSGEAPRMIAMLVGITTLDEPNFLDLVSRRLPNGGGDMVVIAPQQSIFVTGTNPQAFMLKPLPIDDGNRTQFEKIRDGFEGTLVTNLADGVDRLISTKQIPRAHWVVVARLPSAEAFAPVRELRRFVFAGAAGLSLLIGFWLVFFLGRALGPLGRAAHQMDAMTGGSLPLAPLPEGGADEVGRLIHSFNHLQARLAHNAAALQLTSSVFENTLQGVLIADRRGIIVDVNPAFTTITGYPREEAIGGNPSILKSGRQDEDFYAGMWHALLRVGHWRGEIWNRRKDGEIYPELLTISTVKDERGAVGHFVAVFSDISQIKQHQSQLEDMAHFDALTGLPNRLLLADRMRQAISQAKRADHLLAVCYLDLDDFKPINDKLGHEAGDLLLIEIAGRLKNCLRGGDTAARLGGDEFVLLLTEVSHIDECEIVLDRLLKLISAPCQIAGHTVSVSASIGITLYPFDDADPDTLLRHADQAMYKSKQSGRQCYHLFDATTDRRTQAHQEMLRRVEEALVANQFLLHYQPQVDLRQGRIVGAEALIRWQEPSQGLLLPGAFLPEIEHHELIVALGEWVIATALAQLARWQADGLDIQISVNIAALHLQRDNFVPRLRELLAAQPQAKVAGRLELEVVESTAIEDMSRIPQLIEECRALGIGFAIDDFGIGYSSLTYFKMLPVDTLKIDQSFIRDMLKDPDDLAIVEGVIGLSEVFRRRVIAEGVETVEHGIALLGLGCDLAQGYGIARPMSAVAFLDWARQWQPHTDWHAVSRARWPREDIQLLVAENNHRNWVDRMALLVAGQTVGETPEIDPHACRFGQWYNSAGRTRYGHLDEFLVIDGVHRQVHALGRQIVDLCAAGEHVAAQPRLAELIQLREQLIALLRRLKALVTPRSPQNR